MSINPLINIFLEALGFFYHHPLILDLIAVNGGDGVIHDITGTTVYVVAVICVIPVAGLVAWVVRYVVKKKVRISFIGLHAITTGQRK